MMADMPSLTAATCAARDSVSFDTSDGRMKGSERGTTKRLSGGALNGDWRADRCPDANEEFQTAGREDAPECSADTCVGAVASLKL